MQLLIQIDHTFNVVTLAIQRLPHYLGSR